MMWLTEKIEFPPYELASPEGIIALGGDLSPERLLYAYQKGIFPWYSEGEPIIWYCPEKRMVLFPDELKVSKSLHQAIRKKAFTITENTAFEEVIHACKHIERKDDFGTWITDEMETAYIALHKLGHAKSVEIWKDDELVGGLYGLQIGNVFCGESMFSKVSNASKIAFVYLVWSGRYELIDCQIYNDHLASLGAREIERNEFLSLLKK
ncbi:leucyl/phenylalanyl-tRNA--protein transferase [Flavobacteriaceae bacterium S356]|uniref:Leucyl/phenylalanyl-tRNA--protein transferase n=1 Tax=Asprobacillus argus TaxID=3076534 RepID=A0ABU3LGZ8_9FLAO|nr:leucyl/phenylalanyl-tRNA--protein transferase [Flavobacteriaceae bacterium S356]